MSEYEFTEKQNKILSTLSKRLVQIGILFLITGIGRLIFSGGFVQRDGWQIATFVLILIGLVNLIMGITFWRPADNFKRMVTTEGRDIAELMTGLRELNAGFNVLQYLVILSVILVLINFILRL